METPPNFDSFPCSCVTNIFHGPIFENHTRILENSQSYCPHSRLKVRGFLRIPSTSFLKPVAALILENSQNSRTRSRLASLVPSPRVPSPWVVYTRVVRKRATRLGVPRPGLNYIIKCIESNVNHSRSWTKVPLVLFQRDVSFEHRQQDSAVFVQIAGEKQSI